MRNNGEILHLGGIGYRIDGLEGAGSSAVVYRASYEDALTRGVRHRVFLKELFPLTADGSIHRGEHGEILVEEQARGIMEFYRERFLAGNRANLELLSRDPSAVAGNINSFACYGSCYSVLSVHGGENLMNLLAGREHGMPLEEAVSVLQRILESLAVFHKSGLLHLDISPDNVLLLPRQALLIDYNSIWDCSRADWEDFPFSEKQGYCAPEVKLRNVREIGQATDLFSVCAVFFRLLTGKTLPEEALLGKPLGKYLTAEVTASWQAPKTAAAKAVQILTKGLHMLPRKRYQTVEALMEDLEEVRRRIQGRGITPSTLWESSGAVFRTRRSERNPYLPQPVRLTSGGVYGQRELLAALAGGSCILLTGPGGMGKSRFLRELWREGTARWDPRQPVTVHIALRDYQQTDGAPGFILRSILKGLRFSEEDGSYADGLHALEQLLDSAPGVILLLDGLNEAGSRTAPLLQEMEALSRKKHVGILVTDRTAGVLEYGLPGFSQAELSPLEEKQVVDALGQAGRAPRGELLELLKNPMLLFLYIEAMTGEAEADKLPKTPEGLIRLYLDQFCRRALRSDSGNQVRQLRTRYILDHLLPELAAVMESEKRSVLTPEAVGQVCEKNYANLRSGSFEAAFPEYKGKSRSILRGIANASEWYDLAVREMLADRFGLLYQTENENYCLLHDNFQKVLAQQGEKNQQALRRMQHLQWQQRLKKLAPLLLAAVLTMGLFFGGKLLLGSAPGRSAASYTDVEQNEIDNAMVNLSVSLGEWSSLVQAQMSLVELAANLEDADGVARGNLLEQLAYQQGYLPTLRTASISQSSYGALLEIQQEKGLFSVELVRSLSQQTRAMRQTARAGLAELEEILENPARQREREEFVRVYGNYLNAQREYMYCQLSALLGQMTRQEREELTGVLDQTQLLRDQDSWLTETKEEDLTGSDAYKALLAARSDLKLHGVDLETAPEEFRAIVDDFSRLYLQLDEDAQRLDQVLVQIGDYINGGDWADAMDSAQELLSYYELELAAEKGYTLEEDLAELLTEYGILAEEYQSFRGSRANELYSQWQMLSFLTSYLEMAELDQAGLEQLKYQHRLMEQYQDVMGGYYFYGCLNYWFVDAGPAEFAYLQETVIDKLQSYLPAERQWYTLRSQTEERTMEYLDQYEALLTLMMEDVEQAAAELE